MNIITTKLYFITILLLLGTNDLYSQIDEELREAEREVMSDAVAQQEMSEIMETYNEAEENLDIPGQEERVRQARESGNQADIDREERILRERRKALDRTKVHLEQNASTKVQRLLRKLRQTGRWGLFSMLGLVIDGGINVIGAINNPRSRFGAIYRAALEGNCSRVNALIQSKTLLEHALELQPITGASAIATEEFLAKFFELARKACRGE